MKTLRKQAVEAAIRLRAHAQEMLEELGWNALGVPAPHQRPAKVANPADSPAPRASTPSSFGKLPTSEEVLAFIEAKRAEVRAEVEATTVEPLHPNKAWGQVREITAHTEPLLVAGTWYLLQGESQRFVNCKEHGWQKQIIVVQDMSGWRACSACDFTSNGKRPLFNESLEDPAFRAEVDAIIAEDQAKLDPGEGRCKLCRTKNKLHKFARRNGDLYCDHCLGWVEAKCTDDMRAVPGFEGEFGTLETAPATPVGATIVDDELSEEFIDYLYGDVEAGAAEPFVTVSIRETLAFNKAMQGHSYGEEERDNAFHWFKAGYRTQQDPGADAGVGIQGKNTWSGDEYELELHVRGHKGTMFLSQEFWQAIHDHAWPVRSKSWQDSLNSLSAKKGEVCKSCLGPIEDTRPNSLKCRKCDV